MAEEATCVFVVGSGSRQEEPGMSVISHRKWAPQERPVIVHIKARSKHSLETETAWHKKKKKKTQLYLVKLVGVSPGLCAVAVCVRV